MNICKDTKFGLLCAKLFANDWCWPDRAYAEAYRFAMLTNNPELELTPCFYHFVTLRSSTTLCQQEPFFSRCVCIGQPNNMRSGLSLPANSNSHATTPKPSIRMQLRQSFQFACNYAKAFNSHAITPKPSIRMQLRQSLQFACNYAKAFNSHAITPTPSILPYERTEASFMLDWEILPFGETVRPAKVDEPFYTAIDKKAYYSSGQGLRIMYHAHFIGWIFCTH